MEDHEIIRLYWDRDETAIRATDEKYGAYCTAIARNILASREDAEECVSDTWLRAWNAMPPQRPNILSAFLGRITRNLSFNRCRFHTAQKRHGGELPLILEELEECVSGGETPEEALDRKALTQAIERFLDTLPPVKRSIFVDRYWYARSVSEIARRRHMTENHVSVTLSRLRQKLRRHLMERGIEV